MGMGSASSSSTERLVGSVEAELEARAETSSVLQHPVEEVRHDMSRRPVEVLIEG